MIGSWPGETLKYVPLDRGQHNQISIFSLETFSLLQATLYASEDLASNSTWDELLYIFALHKLLNLTYWNAYLNHTHDHQCITIFLHDYHSACCWILACAWYGFHKLLYTVIILLQKYKQNITVKIDLVCLFQYYIFVCHYSFGMLRWILAQLQHSRFMSI